MSQKISRPVWSLLHMEDNMVVYGKKATMDHIEKICRTLQNPIRIEARTDDVEVMIRTMAGVAESQGYDVYLEDGLPRHPDPWMNQPWAMVRYRNKNVIYGPVDYVDVAYQAEWYGSKDSMVKRLDVRRYIIEESIRDNSNKIVSRYKLILLSDDGYDHDGVQMMQLEEIRELNRR